MKRNYWYIGISEWLKNKLLGTETIVVRARNKAGQYLKDDPKDRIRELEDVKNDNPYQKFIFVAQAIDSWRIIPRAFLAVYMYLLYFTTFWFMDLTDPSFEQSGLISIVVGAGAAWFGLYTNSHKKT